MRDGHANVVVVGQSGQGVIMVSRILMTACLEAGLHAACTEFPAGTHRFAITSSHVRIGPDVISPRILAGGADLIVGVEPLECVRVALLLGRPDTRILMDTEIGKHDGVTNPLLGDRAIPLEVPAILDLIREQGAGDAVVLDASRIALTIFRRATGANMVLLGAAAGTGCLPLPAARLRRVLAALVPAGTAETNEAAFDAGLAAYSRTLSAARAARVSS